MLTTDQLMVLLADSGIVPTQRLRVFQEQIRHKQDVETLDVLTRELVQAGLLTSYQASEIERGQADRLTFGNYVLLDRIGRGGMGEVFRARHSLMNREVAVKFLGPTAVDKIGSIRRFKREVRAAAKLIHPNIVTALDAGERDADCFLVMEYVRGTTLSQHVRRGGPLTIITAVELALQIAEALAYAHSRGIVHRDIKPGNMILSDDGTVKILDLGLSQLRPAPENPATPDDGAGAATEEQLTEFGNFMGTVDFMAPEQAVDPHDVDERADIYSLGCTLYFLLTGNPPFPGKSVLDRLLAHRDGIIPSLGDSRDDVPARLESLVRAMLAKSPNQRMQRMEDVVLQLKACRSELSDPTSDFPETVQFVSVDSEPTPGSHRGRWGLVVAPLLAIVAVAAWLNPWDRDVSPVTSPPVEQVEIPELTGPVDLLKQIEPDRDVVKGDGWKLDEGRLVTAAGSPSMLAIDQPIAGDYSLEIEASRLSGGGPLVLGLVLNDNQCYVLLDANRKEGSLFAIGTDQQGRLAEYTHRDVLFEIGKPVRLRCVVLTGTPATIEVTADDETLIAWTGNASDLKLDSWDAAPPGRLFVGTNNESSFTIDRFTVAPLSKSP